MPGTLDFRIPRRMSGSRQSGHSTSQGRRLVRGRSHLKTVLKGPDSQLFWRLLSAMSGRAVTPQKAGLISVCQLNIVGSN